MIIFGKINRNEIAWKLHKQATHLGFQNLRESVAEGVVGKIYCPCRKDPVSPDVGMMVLSRSGERSPVVG